MTSGGRWCSGIPRPRTAAVSLPVLVVALALALGLVVACSPGTDPSLDDRIRASSIEEGRAARQRGFDELASVLEDGRYTDAEHAKMFSLYEECLAKAGYRLGPRQESPIDGRSYESEILNLNEVHDPNGAAQLQCLTRYLGQSAMTESPGRMAEPLRRFMQTCLAGAGYRTNAEDRTVRQMVSRSGRESEDALSDCIDQGMAQLYPDFPGHGDAIPSIY